MRTVKRGLIYRLFSKVAEYSTGESAPDAKSERAVRVIEALAPIMRDRDTRPSRKNDDWDTLAYNAACKTVATSFTPMGSVGAKRADVGATYTVACDIQADKEYWRVSRLDKDGTITMVAEGERQRA